MTANVHGFYGDDEQKNRFTLGSVGAGEIEGGNWLGGKNKDEKYFNLVRSTDPGRGDILVYNEEFGADRLVGYMKPGEKKITPFDPGTGVKTQLGYLPPGNIASGPHDYEKNALARKGVAKNISTQAQQVQTKDVIAGTNLNGATNKDGTKVEATGASDEGIEKAKKITNETQETNKKLGSDPATTKAIEEGAGAKKGSLGATGTAEQKRNAFGTLVYPTTLRQDEQDVIKFTLMEYKPKGFKMNQGSFGQFDQSVSRSNFKSRIPLGSVTLPVPGGIRDNNAVTWDAGTMTAGEAFAARSAVQGAFGELDLSGELGNLSSAIKGNASDVQNAIKKLVADMAANKGNDFLTRSTGQINNPNMELLFKQPNLRQFQFGFKLTPRDPDEASVVLRILNFFKRGMAPIRTKGALFLKSPHTFGLEYLYRGKNMHPGLNMFKECALSACGVEYAPDGNYATYDDGVMIAYQVTMAFQELTPIYNDDYASVTPGTIGY